MFSDKHKNDLDNNAFSIYKYIEQIKKEGEIEYANKFMNYAKDGFLKYFKNSRRKNSLNLNNNYINANS